MGMKETILDLGGQPVEPLSDGINNDVIKGDQITPAEKVLGGSSGLEELKEFLSSGNQMTAEQRQMVEEKIAAFGNGLANPQKEDVDVLTDLKGKGSDAAGNALKKMEDENKIDSNNNVNSTGENTDKTNADKSDDPVKQTKNEIGVNKALLYKNPGR